MADAAAKNPDPTTWRGARALIALHLEGYDHAEVGGILGLTANHVGVKLHRIKARLTELLKPD